MMRVNGAITALVVALKFTLDAVATVLVPVVLSPVLAWLYLDSLWEAEEGRWRTWFAWRPMTMTATADIVWMEPVEYTLFRRYTYYRRRGDQSVPLPVDDYDGE